MGGTSPNQVTGWPCLSMGVTAEANQDTGSVHGLPQAARAADGLLVFDASNTWTIDLRYYHEIFSS